MPNKNDVTLYIPQQQTMTLWFVREGMPEDRPEFWADVRADLTFNERKAMQDQIKAITAPIEERLRAENEDRDDDDRWDDVEIARLASMEIKVEDIWDAIAPYVLDWSVGYLNDDGEPQKSDPPCIGGGKQFALIAESFVVRILNHLMLRSEGEVDVSFLEKSKRTPKSTASGKSRTSTRGK